MKKIFKLFTVALVAVTTFVTAGCSCSLNDKKMQEKVRLIESTNVYQKGDDMQDFTFTIVEHDHKTGKSVKTVYDTDFAQNKYIVVVTKDGKDTTTTYTTPIQEDKFVNGKYNVMKKQPINSYGEMTNQKFRNLMGLEDAQDGFLVNKTVDISAKKPIFKKDVTFVIEYQLNVVNRNRITMIVNEDNKITSFKLELVGRRAIDNRGNYEEFLAPQMEVTIVYK